EILPTAQAISRIFARLGEKKNRQKARLKFVVQKLGIDEFRRLVVEERKTIPYDPRWDQYGKDLVDESLPPSGVTPAAVSSPPPSPGILADVSPSTPSPGTPGEGRVRALSDKQGDSSWQTM